MSLRIATYERDGAWRPALAVGDRLVDLEAAAGQAGLDGGSAWSSVRRILAERRSDLGAVGDGATALAEAGESLDPGAIRLGPPVPDPDKILCVGLNYREHAGEARLDEPEVPVIFAKFPNVLVGAGEPIRLPPGNPRRVDYECELAVVIGREACALSESEALDAVAGWMPFNDVTARDLQMQTSQWTVGKSPDSFGPCGPFLVLDDDLGDGPLDVETRVNGELRQQAQTDQMIFSVAHLVAFLSRTMTLVPGDIVATGTPAGVGAHRSPPTYLAEGDVVDVRVGDQVLTNPVTLG